MHILGLFLAFIIWSGISVLGATALFEAVVKRRVDGAWDK